MALIDRARNFRGRLVLAEGRDHLDQLGWEFREVGQGFVNHHRLARAAVGGGASGRPPGRDALALDQKDRLVGLVGVAGLVALDEHGSSRGRATTLRKEREGGKNNSYILETTYILQ